MIGRGDDDMRVLAQQALFHGNVGRRLPHDRDVEIVATQRLADVLAISDLEHDVDLGMTPRECANRKRHEIFRRADGADRNAAAAAASDHVEGLLTVNESGLDAFGQRQDLVPGIGQPHPVAGSLDQRKTGQSFEIAKLQSDRRLREIE